jgi:hypothetical protein
MKYWTPRRIRISLYVLFLGDYTVYTSSCPFYSTLYNANGQPGFLRKGGEVLLNLKLELKQGYPNNNPFHRGVVLIIKKLKKFKRKHILV